MYNQYRNIVLKFNITVYIGKLFVYMYFEDSISSNININLIEVILKYLHLGFSLNLSCEEKCIMRFYSKYIKLI